jgi:hypothetical protein
LLQSFVLSGRVGGTGGAIGLLLRGCLEAVVGVSLLVAARYLASGRDQKAASFAHTGLLLSLTTVNLLVFYFDQFRALFVTGGQLVLLLAVSYYRQRYLLGGDRGQTPSRSGKR